MTPLRTPPKSFISGTTLLQLATSLLFPLMWYAPFLCGPNRIRFFSTDGIGLYGAQFAHQYHRFRDLVFSGVDFFTANGSSQYFLRPNIVTENAVHFLAYLLPLRSPMHFFFALLCIHFLHCVTAVFFAQRVGTRYFRLTPAAALFFATLYAFSTGAIAAWQFVPFYYCAMWVPVLMWAALRSLRPVRPVGVLLLSFAYAGTLLCGYATMAVFAVAMVLAFVVFFHVHASGGWRPSLPGIAGLMRPAALGMAVAFPYYLAVLQFHKAACSMPKSLFTRAHQIALKLPDLMSMISFGVPTLETIEVFSLYIGLIPLALLGFFLLSGREYSSEPVEHKSVLKFMLLAYGGALLISFGPWLRFSDTFFFMVPFLGGSHIYPRFLILAFFPFSAAAAVLLNWSAEVRERGLARGALSAIVLSFVVVAGLFHYKTPPADAFLFSSSLVLLELFFAGIFMAVYLRGSASWVSWTAVVLVFGLNMTHFYRNTDGNATVVKNEKFLFLNRAEDRAFNDFLKANAPGKALIKYEYAGSREVFKYVIPNHPWYVERDIKLSNYYGNELALASDLDYRRKFPWYGILDRHWIKRTGCDYLITNSTGRAEFKDDLDPSVSFKLSDGSVVLKTRYGVKGAFDNGLIRIPGASPDAVKSFETDYATRVSFETSGDVPLEAEYLLYPELSLRLYVDGKRAPVTLKDGLLTISLPAGTHRVEIRYVNRLLDFFNVVYWLYLAALVAAAAAMLWKRKGQVRGAAVPA